MKVRVHKHNRFDKSIRIDVGDLTLMLDNDDVNTDEVELMLPQIQIALECMRPPTNLARENLYRKRLGEARRAGYTDEAEIYEEALEGL